ncbi:MAG: tRNA (adenosine(37)-N6)-threonylcarbamoyltransferase complex transferase subunit TsaD [Clostridia bacterium]|nr:tRNA (adenosine(37)-N6)-threonylcarbamoyltransferase complex transferase subunit TsaD [Clostridia bacterium]
MIKYYEKSKAKCQELKHKDSILILGIESSCDETSVAIVKNGREILTNIIASQIDIHKKFGGVVPEVASRNHILAIDKVFKKVLETAGKNINEIDAVAITYGAGLMGALLVGVNFAKALAYSLDIPCIAVSHVEGHISANYLTHKNLRPPFICLMVSGGHTAILKVNNYISHTLLGSTVDDAAGEAFDKVARVLGLSYPGGVQIDNLAKFGKPNIKFTKHNALKDSLNFSFSGIKTAVINYVNSKKMKNEDFVKEDICASFQKIIVDDISNKAVKACKLQNLNKLVVAGGVGANSYLKENLTKLCKDNNIELYFPDLKLCTDNAAMIASSGYFNLMAGKNIADLSLTAKPTVSL